MQRGKGTPCVSLPDRQDDLAEFDGSGADLAGVTSDSEINIKTDWDISSQVQHADFLVSVLSAYEGDEWLRKKVHRRGLEQKHSLWWKRHAFYIPAEHNLRSACI